MTVYTPYGAGLVSAPTHGFTNARGGGMAVQEPQIHNEDEAALARLGYKQELSRSWSGFSNFAISFSIISILAGCFTTFGQAWSNGGPIAISWGWPIISIFILIIGFTMSELVSAMPTSGGIYSVSYTHLTLPTNREV